MIPARVALVTRLVLRFGMLLGLVVLSIGVLGVTVTPAASAMTPDAYLAAALALRPIGLLVAGLAVLAFTPIAGVATIGVGCLLARRYRLAALAGVVLILVVVAMVVR